MTDDSHDVDLTVLINGIAHGLAVYGKASIFPGSMTGGVPADVSVVRWSLLRRQLHTRLKPVLRPVDFGKFNLEGALATIARIGARTTNPFPGMQTPRRKIVP